LRTCPTTPTTVIHWKPAAEREAEAQLRRALADEIRSHAVEPHRREQQRRGREHAEQQRAEALARHRARDDVVHRRDARHRQRRVDRAHSLAHRRGERRRVAGRGAGAPHDDRGGRLRPLEERHVDLRLPFLLRPAVAHVPHHADHRRVHALRPADEVDPPA
jgi:hypothetical protein